MIPFEEFTAFEALVKAGNMTDAGELLNTSRTVVSRRVGQLEQGLGVALVERVGSRYTPTERGRAALRWFSSARLQYTQLLQLLTSPGSVARQRLHVAVAVNADSLATWFPSTEMLLAGNDQWDLELVVDDQSFTRGHLANGKVMACVSSDPDPLRGYLVEPVGSMRYVPVASPDFVQRHFPSGLTFQAMEQAAAVAFDRKDRLQLIFLETLHGRPIHGYPVHFVPSTDGLFKTILSGIAYGVVPEVQARSALESGALVNIAPDIDLNLRLYWHFAEERDAITQVLTDLVTAASAKLPKY